MPKQSWPYFLIFLFIFFHICMLEPLGSVTYYGCIQVTSFRPKVCGKVLTHIRVQERSWDPGWQQTRLGVLYEHWSRFRDVNRRLEVSCLFPLWKYMSQSIVWPQHSSQTSAPLWIPKTELLLKPKCTFWQLQQLWSDATTAKRGYSIFNTESWETFAD